MIFMEFINIEPVYSYKGPTEKLDPSIGAISPFVDLHGRQKALWKSKTTWH